MKCVVAFGVIAAVLSNAGTISCLPATALAQDQMQSPKEGFAKQELRNDDAEIQGSLTNGVLLKSGTEVRLVFAQTVSSKHATVGEKVELRVAEGVRVDGIVVVPAGARVLGTVVQGKKNEKYGNSKTLAVEVDYIVVKGKRIRLTGARLQKPETNTGSATAATIGFGLSGLMIYMSQREARIREGSPATGYVIEDVIFTQAELRSEAETGN